MFPLFHTWILLDDCIWCWDLSTYLETFHFNYDIWEKSVLQHFVHFKLPYWGPSSNPLRVKKFFHFLLHNSLQIVITIHIYSKQNDVRIMYQELFQFQNLQSSLQYCVAYDCTNSYYRGFQASSKKWILTENWKINCKKSYSLTRIRTHS